MQYVYFCSHDGCGESEEIQVGMWVSEQPESMFRFFCWLKIEQFSCYVSNQLSKGKKHNIIIKKCMYIIATFSDGL